MDFALNEEQLEFKDRCRTFAREVIRPAARKHDEEESTPWEVIKEARRQGFQGLEAIQRSAGDSEGQMQVISAEELHWGCAGIALAIAGSGLAAAGIAASGTPEQIGRWVPECFGTGEEIKLGAYAVTEPQAGSDVKSLKTTAKRDGDEWVLNGTKVFITNGGIADVHVVVATVDPELGTRGQASFVDRQGHPGPRARARRSRSSASAPPTPPRSCSRTAASRPRTCSAARRSWRRSWSGARSGQKSRRRRRAGDLRDDPAAGRRLGARHRPGGLRVDPRVPRRRSPKAARRCCRQQRIQQTLADVATEIEAARLLVQRAAWMGRNGVPMTGGQGSMSKLKAGDVTMWATTTLMDLVGPFAWSTECPLEKLFRDAKIYQLFEGTAEIQRMVISRMQAREYAERLGFGAEVAAEAMAAEPAKEPVPA